MSHHPEVDLFEVASNSGTRVTCNDTRIYATCRKGSLGHPAVAMLQNPEPFLMLSSEEWGKQGKLPFANW